MTYATTWIYLKMIMLKEDTYGLYIVWVHFYKTWQKADKGLPGVYVG